MNYFSINVDTSDLTGWRMNTPDDSDESWELLKQLQELERKVIKALEDQGFIAKHAYSWSDGSLYLDCCGEGIPQGDNFTARVVDKNDDPYKVGHDTLESYLAAPKNKKDPASERD